MAASPDSRRGLGGAAWAAGAIESLVMSFVYPQLKPMLEASIRKVTVTVNWKEGLRDRDLAIVQYVTSSDARRRPSRPQASGGRGCRPGLPRLPNRFRRRVPSA